MLNEKYQKRSYKFVEKQNLDKTKLAFLNGTIYFLYKKKKIIEVDKINKEPNS